MLFTEQSGGEKGWTAAEKIQLQRLAVIHNYDWPLIGRLIGRHNKDCMATFERSEERETIGAFSKKEDDDIVNAVRKVMKLPKDMKIIDMPAKGENFKYVNLYDSFFSSFS